MTNIFTRNIDFNIIFLREDLKTFSNFLIQENAKDINIYNELNFENCFQNQDESSENFFLNFPNIENLKNNSNIIINNDSQTKSKSNLLPFAIDKPIPEPFYEKDILHIILKKVDINEKIKDKIKNLLKSKSILENNFVQIVRKEITEKLNTRGKRLNKDNKNKVNFGRKRKGDESIRIHNKYTPDNIITKIKNILKRYLIVFVNNIIFSLYGRENINIILNKLNLPKHASLSLIKDIDYKSIANKKRKNENLALLNISIKKILSFNVSGRYRKIKNKDDKCLTNYNKIIIEYLFEGDKNRNIFDFIFNKLNLEDWLDIFTRKKDLNDFPQIHSLNENEIKIVEESLVTLDNYFEELFSEGDIYFLCFILLIYNYKRYYLIKQERKAK